VNRERIPLSQRRGDILIIAFFLVNLLFITYVVDLEQVIIPNVSHFTYPVWPPRPLVDLFHWYGRTYDPLIVLRPVWWRATIWLDVLCFGPFYVFAIYAYIRGREWIRIPSIIYSSVMLTNLVIIFSEEFAGPNASPQPLIVLLENLAWVLFPIYIIYRMWRSPFPFTRPAQATATQPLAQQSSAESGLECA
jgi:hypothetical protein